MNKKISSILALSMLIGILAVPVMTLAGTCGGGDDCQYCLTEPPCIAEANCAWETSVCVFDGVLPLTIGNMSALLTYPSTLFTDLSLLIVLIIGLPLAFWIIRKTISLVRTR